MAVHDWTDTVRSALGAPVWLIQVFLTVLLTAVASQVALLVIRRLQQRLTHNSVDWDDALFEGARTPLRLVIWIIGMTAALGLVDADVRHWAVTLEQLRHIGVISCGAWFAFRFVGEYQTRCIARMQQEPGHDPTAILAIGRLVRASIVITGALVVLETLGFSISGVLAFGGVGGVAVGFAAKDMLANFFGGLMIFLDRPFTVGDWIKSPDRSIEGIVERIGWRITMVRSFEKEPMYIPNSTFSSIAVITPSRMTHRRLRESLGLRYQDVDCLPQLVENIRDCIQRCEEVDTTQGVVVCVDGFGESSVNVLVQAYASTLPWAAFMQWRQRLLLEIAGLVEAAGADFAYPTRTLLLEHPEPEAQSRDDSGIQRQHGAARVQ